MDGRPASALCGFRAGDGYPSSQAAMTEVASHLGWSETAQQTMWQRGAYLFTCLMEPHDDFWTIENVATLPQYRRRHLVDALIAHALDEGRTQCLRQAQITFLIGNDPAERAYTRAGFGLEAERRHPDFEAASGSPGLRRFIRHL